MASLFDTKAAQSAAAKGAAVGASSGNPWAAAGTALADYAMNFGSTIGATAYSGGLSKKAQMRAFQHQYDMYMLDYNLHTPAQQMKLLKQAHLNPNLVYGGGNPGNVSASAPSAPTGNTPSMVAPKLNLLDTYLDFKLKDAQIRNLDAQSKEAFARAGYTTSQTSHLPDKWELDIIKKGLLTNDVKLKEEALKILQEKGWLPAHGPQGFLNQTFDGANTTTNSVEKAINGLRWMLEEVKDSIPRTEYDRPPKRSRSRSVESRDMSTIHTTIRKGGL